MDLKNKLGLNEPLELAHAEEKISERKAIELSESGAPTGRFWKA